MPMPARIAAAAVIGVLVHRRCLLRHRPDVPGVATRSDPSPEPIVGAPPARMNGCPFRRLRPRCYRTVACWSRAARTTPVKLDTAELYDPPPAPGQRPVAWPFRASTTPRRCSRNGTVLVIGGDTAGTTEIFDPASGIVVGRPTSYPSTADSMRPSRSTTGRSSSLVATSRTIGDRHGGDLRSGHGVLRSTTDMTGWRASPPTVVLLQDGRVLVTGGFVAPLSNRSAEVFDPTPDVDGHAARHAATGDTSMGPPRCCRAGRRSSLPVGRFARRSVRPGQRDLCRDQPDARQPRRTIRPALLPDGSVLVVGGAPAEGDAAIDLAQRFDPLTGTWSATASMLDPRIERWPCVLADGRLLDGRLQSRRPASEPVRRPSTEL